MSRPRCALCEGAGRLELSEATSPRYRGRPLFCRCHACDGRGEELDDCRACGQPAARHEGEGGYAFCDDICEAEWLALRDEETGS